MASRDELRTAWVGGERPDLPSVAHHNLLEVQVKVARQDAVFGRANKQLAAAPLGNNSDATKMIRQLCLHTDLAVHSVKFNQPAVFAAAGNNTAVLQYTH